MSEQLVYDNQTAFNAIYAFAAKQQERCWNEAAQACVYNGLNNHCYVGILIKGIELGSDNIADVDNLTASNEEVAERLAKCDVDFLTSCQKIHDDPENWSLYLENRGREHRLRKLSELAKIYDLTIPKD